MTTALPEGQHHHHDISSTLLQSGRGTHPLLPRSLLPEEEEDPDPDSVTEIESSSPETRRRVRTGIPSQPSKGSLQGATPVVQLL
eukprot:Skav210796  [mRNA]  locus=scaffold275:204368:207428:- [translate_table: standard]